jgi:membrane protein
MRSGVKRSDVNSPGSIRRSAGSKEVAADIDGGAAEVDRGRSANRPSEIPGRGWKDIVYRIFNGISEDRILANAAAVTFYALLAVFPLIATLVSIYGFFSDSRTITDQVTAMSGILPGGAVDVIRDELNRLTSQPKGKLGVSFFIALVVSLWSANGGIKALFDALNVIYEEKETRGFFRLNAQSLLFTVAIIGFLVVALISVVALPAILDLMPSFAAQLVGYARWPGLAVLVALGLALIYRYGPDRAEPRWRWISWGSAFAAIVWLSGSAIFSWYAANFGSFNKTYGSLGAVIGFMVWMWMSAIVILAGGKLNAEIEHQTGRDTTAGPPKPRGARGAKMADTVGPVPR